ncbi:MAG TPA: acyl-CoA desaturase [Acidimicrobiales bacterium]|nr:acyl-CoA desaturase [Acidimicrobiales bacterium]
MSKRRSRTTPVVQAVLPRAVTALLVFGPLAAVAVVVPLMWGHAIHLRDVILGLVLYVIFGHGISVGFHRLFTHRSFTPIRSLKVLLAVAGSMAVEGSVTSWVANHRRHHVYSDRPGDPHSPHVFTGASRAQWRGFLHAHVGWLFRVDPTSAERFAPDLLKDGDIRVVNKLFPVLAVASLALPFFIGWGLSGSLTGAVAALVWAGLVRMALFHHVTWSVNSVCHMIGRRPFVTKDQSRNVAALAVLSLGESWHNLHHAYPTSARHGALPGQIDSSARLIRMMEKMGWVSNVRWPTAERLESLAAGRRQEELIAA